MSSNGDDDDDLPRDRTIGTDDDNSSIVSYLAQLDLANGRCHSHNGRRFGGTPYIRTDQSQLNVLDKPFLDIFIPHQTDGDSCQETMQDYYCRDPLRYSNMKGFKAMSCIGIFQNHMRTVVIENISGEESNVISVEEVPDVKDEPPEEMDIDYDTKSLYPDGDCKRRRVEKEKPGYTPPPNASALTEEMVKENERVLDREDDDFIREIGSTQLFRKNLATLKLGEWLEDRVIDAYLNLIKERNRQLGLYSVYIFKSTFYALLGTDKGLEKVRETSDDDNIFKYDLLLIPVCKNDHWRLCVVYVQSRIIVSYNSLPSPDHQIRKNIERFLIIEEKRLALKNGVPLNPDAPAWKLLPEEVPQQENCNDCGVFLLQFANYVSGGQQIDFSQEHMDYFRELILYELIQGNLLF